MSATAAMVRAAVREHAAVAAINVCDSWQAAAVVDAAEQLTLPVIIQTAASTLAAVGESALATAALVARDHSDADVVVHLDHCRDLDLMRRCLDRGFDSVMIDGSHLSFRDNVALTRAAVQIAHAHGATIEAELGAVAGDEDRTIESAAQPMTTSSDVRAFVDATGVDLLAVAVGNVHGIPLGPVHLDLDRLEELHASTEVPLVLHGASGLPADVLGAAVHRGVGKVNVNTEVRRAYLASVRASLAEDDSDDVLLHLSRARTSMSEVVAAKITALRTAAGKQMS